jgi:nitrate/TMAO reductase-like tetraheme cytochrome c subunit
MSARKSRRAASASASASKGGSAGPRIGAKRGRAAGPSAGMRGPQAWWRRANWLRIVVIAAAVVAVGVVAFFPVALATDQPSFCASCHGMRPFFSAWQGGAHSGVGCIECHVDAGYPARFAHKFVALDEVWDQFTGAPTFPNYNADIPNSRCLRCHPDIASKPAAGGFSHQLHLGNGLACAKCHATVGHQVSFQSLSEAGVLNKNQELPGQTFVGLQTSTGVGKPSALPGHKPVVCSNCHDQAGLPCSFCHTAPPSHFGIDCKLCHKPNVAFTQFTHPPSGEHSYLSRPCVKCHPNGYTTVYCTCHNGHPPVKRS